MDIKYFPVKELEPKTPLVNKQMWKHIQRRLLIQKDECECEFATVILIFVSTTEQTGMHLPSASLSNHSPDHKWRATLCKKKRVTYHPLLSLTPFGGAGGGPVLVWFVFFGCGKWLCLQVTLCIWQGVKLQELTKNGSAKANSSFTLGF